MNNQSKLKAGAQFLLPLTLVASGLYLALGQMALATPSNNNTLAVYGRQVTLEGNPTITTDGSTISVSQLPKVSDQDNDAHVGWQYVWEVEGSAGIEQSTNILTTIPPLAVSEEMMGRNVQLKLNALAEARSYPIATATSALAASNTIRIPYSITSRPPADQWLGYNTVGGTHTIDGRSVVVTVQRAGSLYTGSDNATTYCGDYYPVTSGSIYLANNPSYFIIRFSEPVTNVKMLIVGQNKNETLRIETNAASNLSVFGAYNSGPQASWCNTPTVNGSAIASNINHSLAYLVNVGGAYFTELRILQRTTTDPINGTLINVNYGHATVSQ